MRTLIVSGIAIFLLMILWQPVASGPATVTMVVARHPLVANLALDMHVEKARLIEKYGERLGVRIVVERPVFGSGVEALEAMLAGRVDMTIVGQVPAVSIVVRDLPVYLGSGVAAGRNGHALVLRSDSKFKSLDDLVAARATIGTLIGTTAHQFLEELFRAAYGKGAEAAGIRLVSITPTAALTMPRGLDAVAFWSIIPQTIVAAGAGKVLINEWGYTGPAWTAPPGPGKRVDFVRKSPNYPEGFSLYRNFNAVRKEFADKHPEAVRAYLLAMAEAASALYQGRSTGRELAWNYVKDTWKIPRPQASEVLRNDLTMGIRGWIWLTEGDVRAIIQAGKFLQELGRIPKAPSWDKVMEKFRYMATIEAQVWEETGRNPSLEEMTRKDTPDLRGYPLWMMDRWTRR